MNEQLGCFEETLGNARQRWATSSSFVLPSSRRVCAELRPFAFAAVVLQLPPPALQIVVVVVIVCCCIVNSFLLCRKLCFLCIVPKWWGEKNWRSGAEMEFFLWLSSRHSGSVLGCDFCLQEAAALVLPPIGTVSFPESSLARFFTFLVVNFVKFWMLVEAEEESILSFLRMIFPMRIWSFRNELEEEQSNTIRGWTDAFKSSITSVETCILSLGMYCGSMARCMYLLPQKKTSIKLDHVVVLVDSANTRSSSSSGCENPQRLCN